MYIFCQTLIRMTCSFVGHLLIDLATCKPTRKMLLIPDYISIASRARKWSQRAYLIRKSVKWVVAQICELTGNTHTHKRIMAPSRPMQSRNRLISAMCLTSGSISSCMWTGDKWAYCWLLMFVCIPIGITVFLDKPMSYFWIPVCAHIAFSV